MTKNPIFLMYFVDYNVEIVVFGGGRPPPSLPPGSAPVDSHITLRVYRTAKVM